jgi:membrane-associated protease RseP (regulator of RpoE activity)
METKSRATVWIVVAGLAGLLFGCLGGALAGGIAGYALFRSPSQIVAPQPYEYRIEPTPREPIVPDLRPMPTLPAPAMPLLQGATLVTQVVPESPAERAGIQAGDLIMALDGVSLQEAPLAELIMAYAPGDVVMVTLLRGDRELALELTLGTHPEQSGAPWIGIYYQEMPGRHFERPAP